MTSAFTFSMVIKSEPRTFAFTVKKRDIQNNNNNNNNSYYVYYVVIIYVFMEDL